MAHLGDYPDGALLAAALVTRGVLTAVPGDVSDLDDIMQDVAHSWESDTGWVPFLNTNDAETEITYSPNGTALLFLNRGIVPEGFGSIEVTATALTEGEDFWLIPTDQEVKTRVQFAYVPTGEPGCIAISAFFGYCTELSEDVTAALLGRGIVRYLEITRNSVIGLSGSPKRIKQDDVEKEFGEHGTLVSILSAAYDRAVIRYLAPWKVLAT